MKFLLVFPALFAAAMAAYSSELHEEVKFFTTKSGILSDILEKSMAREDSLCVGVNDCCQPNVQGPCGLGEGDCDGDAECIDGLVCGKCDDEFNVPGLHAIWRMENADFSATDTCCRLPDDFTDS